MANKRLSLLFCGIFIGDFIALFVATWRSGHLPTSLANLPDMKPYGILLIVSGVLAVAFQPDKTISPSAKGIGFGRVPLDYLQLVACSAIAFEVIRFAFVLA